MAQTYRTGGTLTNPVNDLTAARAYLSNDDMTEYVGDGLEEVVLHIQWDLYDESTWGVVVFTHRLLTDEESTALSSWISGQNSDGLGEGFEQQTFAEHFERDRYGNIEEDIEMSSFDWQTNDCTLTLVK